MAELELRPLNMVEADPEAQEAEEEEPAACEGCAEACTKCAAGTCAVGCAVCCCIGSVLVDPEKACDTCCKRCTACSNTRSGDSNTISLQAFLGILFLMLAFMAFIIYMNVTHPNPKWSCDPDAPPSVFGDAFLPDKFTLDETPDKAFNYDGLARVNVLGGFEPELRSTFPLIGFFDEITSPFSQTFAYVESILNGTRSVLRFTATKPGALFWHPPHTITYCERLVNRSAEPKPEPESQPDLGPRQLQQQGYTPSPSYQIERAWFDGTFHSIYEVPPGGERQLVATAQHRRAGYEFDVSLFQGFSVNTEWALVIEATDPKKTLLAEARQWYDRDLIANYGSSNWAVKRRPDNETLLAGVKPLPPSVVAYTAALYDLTVGSDRRRRWIESDDSSRRRR